MRYELRHVKKSRGHKEVQLHWEQLLLLKIFFKT